MSDRASFANASAGRAILKVFHFRHGARRPCRSSAAWRTSKHLGHTGQVQLISRGRVALAVTDQGRPLRLLPWLGGAFRPITAPTDRLTKRTRSMRAQLGPIPSGGPSRSGLKNTVGDPGLRRSRSAPWGGRGREVDRASKGSEWITPSGPSAAGPAAACGVSDRRFIFRLDRTVSSTAWHCWFLGKMLGC